MKTAVISGGNGGLGRTLAGRLEAEGWHCVLMDVTTEGLEASETRTPVQVDLTDSERAGFDPTQALARLRALADTE